MADRKSNALRVTKSLPPELRDAARAFTQRLVDAHFWDARLGHANVRMAAEKIGVSQSALQSFLADGRGGGTKLVASIANFAGVPYDVVLGRSTMPAPPVTPGTPMLGNRPEFAAALGGARAAHPLVPETTWTRIAQSVIPGYRITVESLYNLAREIAAEEHEDAAPKNDVDVDSESQDISEDPDSRP